VKKTEQRVITFIDENMLLESGDRVLVALSGGPDSVFLLHFLNKYKKKFNINIGAFHLNHKIRGKEAEKDEEFCGKLTEFYRNTYFSASEDIRKIADKQRLERGLLQAAYSLETIKFNAEDRYLMSASIIAEVALLNFERLEVKETDKKLNRSSRGRKRSLDPDL
jgi:tRNA(Ile)-lysidine synthase TilS/MesJ